MAIANYIRVSSKDQNTDRQLIGVPCDKVFTDKISGSTRSRPALDRLIEYLREGDTLNVHSIDRLGRDFAHMVQLVEQLYKDGVTVVFHSENITLKDNDHTSKLIFNIMAAIAESERARIKERQKEGIAAAKAKGKRFGPPIKATDEVKAKVLQLVSEGVSRTQIAKDVGLSRTKIYQILAE